MRVIAIAGPAGSGKDTVATFVGHEPRVRRVGLADPIKELVGRVLGFSATQLHGPSVERSKPSAVDWPKARKAMKRRTPEWAAAVLGPRTPEYLATMLDRVSQWLGALEYQAGLGNAITPRLALQLFADRCGRSIFLDIWLDAADREIQLLRRTMGVEAVTITDCRYVNELTRFKAMGADRWFVHRPWALATASDHPSEKEMRSEAAWSLYTRVINNCGTLAALEAEVHRALAAGPAGKE